MAQYKVPQNVDIEDKVIAGLTLRQFAFLMFAGGGVLVSRYILVGPLRFLFIPVAVFVACFGLALAFLKINDRPFENFLLSAGKTFLRPARRIWQKDLSGGPERPAVNTPKENTAQPQENYQEVKNKLERIAKIVDTGGVVPGGERISSFPTVNTDESDEVHDVLQKTEQHSDVLDKLFGEAIDKVTKSKKEPTIDTMASIPVNENQYKYQKMPLVREDRLQEMVDKAQQKINPES